MPNNQEKKVKSFFDQIAPSYQKRYDGSNLFYDYFFQKRLKQATQDIDFKGTKILDIGAGTGALFDELNNCFDGFNYFACDISPQMAAASTIPKAQYFVGSIKEISLPEQQFDFIYMLGVTTYLTEQDLLEHLSFIENHLTKKGMAIISFTNASSIDFKMRRAFQGLNKFLPLNENVVGQSFDFYPYSLDQVKILTAKHFKLKKIVFLNQTIPPFSRIFPKASIRLAGFIKNNISSPTLLQKLSSDFLIFLEK